MIDGLKARAVGLIGARGALVGVAAVSALSIVSSAVGFVFQIVLAAHYGAGAAIDGYLFSISAPTFLAALGATALSYTVVPALVHAEREPGARSALLRTLLKRTAMVALGFALIGGPAVVVQRALLPPSTDLRLITALPAMIALGWATGGAQLLGALFIVELNAARRPIVAALLSLPINLTAILVLLLAPRTILAASVGVLIGSLAVVLLGLALTRRSFAKEAGVAPVDVAVRVGDVGWTLISMSCFSAYAVIDAFWAPRAGGGTLASLGYAQRLIIGIGGLILAGPSAILTPRFAARLRDSGAIAFRREVSRTAMAVGLLAVTAATMLALLARPLIGLAFARGEFDVNDVDRVTIVFRSMLPGFCAMLVSVVLTRAIYCLSGVQRSMAVIGAGWSIIYFVTCGTLLSLGGPGFGFSYSGAWFIYMVVATLILHRYARAS